MNAWNRKEMAEYFFVLPTNLFEGRLFKPKQS